MKTFFELSEAARMKGLIGGFALSAAAASPGLLGVHAPAKPYHTATAPTYLMRGVDKRVPPVTSRPTTMPERNRITQPLLTYKQVEDYVGPHEGGAKLKAYKDGIGKLTIGVGHLLLPSDDALFHSLFGDDIDMDAIRAGTESLTPVQAKMLFRHDIDEHVARTVRRFPAFNTFPVDLRLALIDSIYRGDMTHATADLINKGDFEGAAAQYLTHHQYVNRYKLGIPGIGPRMEKNRDAMLRAANSVRKN